MQRRKLVHLGIAGAIAATAVATMVVTQVGAVPVSAPSSFISITPCRLLDTRAASTVGPRNTPLNQGESATFTVWGANGNCNIPNTATGMATNTTVTNPTADGFLTLWPADDPRPLASNLNWTPTSPPTPNQVTVGLSADGKVSVYNNGGTINVIIDIVGYYLPSAAGPAGPPGPQGEQGDTGPRGFSAWDTIPGLQTVKGEETWLLHGDSVGQNNLFSVPLPGLARFDLDDAHVNFAPSPSAADDDADCTGTFDAPTAPAGMVCLYIDNATNVNDLGGFAYDSTGLLKNGFRVRWDTTAAGPMTVNVSWAYTSNLIIIIPFPDGTEGPAEPDPVPVPGPVDPELP